MNYWPMAIAVPEGYTNPELRYTYDSCSSIEECKKVFLCWQNDYKYRLVVTWIEEDSPKKTISNHVVHVDSFGNEINKDKF